MPASPPLLRVKNNLRIFEEEEVLLFAGTYGKAVTVRKSEVIFRLLQLLAEYPQQQSLTEQLANEFRIDAEPAEQLISRLLESGVLEYYSKEEIQGSTYRRYETQLSFFDLLEPVTSVGQKLATQKKLNEFHVYIIGIGGIGNYAALSFAAAGLGRLTLIDSDEVELSNLNRQIIFNENSIGNLKVEEAIQKIQSLNSDCAVTGLPLMVQNTETLRRIIGQHGKPDLVFISADTPQLPYWVDELAQELQFPFVKCSYQGLTGFAGPLIEPGGKRYSELVQAEPECLNGIIQQHNSLHKHASCSPLNAIVANMAVLGCIKYLTGINKSVILNKRLYFDADSMQTYYEE